MQNEYHTQPYLKKLEIQIPEFTKRIVPVSTIESARRHRFTHEMKKIKKHPLYKTNASGLNIKMQKAKFHPHPIPLPSRERERRLAHSALTAENSML